MNLKRWAENCWTQAKDRQRLSHPHLQATISQANQQPAPPPTERTDLRMCLCGNGKVEEYQSLSEPHGRLDGPIQVEANSETKLGHPFEVLRK